MKKYLSAFLVAALAIGMQQAQAQDASLTPKKALKKAPVKKAAPAEPAAEPGDNDDDAKEPDTSASTAVEFQCELGNKITIYQNASDNQHIALRWKQRLHRMSRVDTSTGANRFENRKYGLVWIDIPTKAMLLDSRKGQQLANECKSPAQHANPQTQQPKAMPKV